MSKGKHRGVWTMMEWRKKAHEMKGSEIESLVLRTCSTWIENVSEGCSTVESNTIKRQKQNRSAHLKTGHFIPSKAQGTSPSSWKGSKCMNQRGGRECMPGILTLGGEDERIRDSRSALVAWDPVSIKPRTKGKFMKSLLTGTQAMKQECTASIDSHARRRAVKSNACVCNWG